MAGDWRSWAKPLAMAALLLGAGRVVFAQPAQSESTRIAETGTLVGRLTDLYSKPLEGVTVILRNQATGAEARAITGKNGFYRFTGLSAGEYTLEAESPQLSRGSVEGIVVAAGHEARVQAALAFEPLPVQPAQPQPIQAAIHPVEPLAPALTAAAAAQPVQALPASVPQARNSAREMPTTESAAVTASLAVEPMQSLPLNGRNLPAAMPLVAPPPPRPIQAASREIDPVAPVVTTTVSGDELQQLPLSGRHWENFVLDTPTASTPAGGQAQSSLRGAGAELAEITVDGAGKGLAFGGTSEGEGGAGANGMAQAWAGGRGFGVSEVAIRAVQTTAGNVESEASRAAGGRVNVETQRGVNGLHGQGFFFDRQNTWGAQNPFTQWITETSEVAPLAPFNTVLFPVFDNFQYSSGQNGPPESYTPPDHETVWGLGVGSQIRRDKLFWFAALDSYHRNDPGLSTVKHPYLSPPVCEIPPCSPTGFFAQPSNDQMQVLSAQLGLSSVNPVAEGLAAYSPMLEALAGLLGPAPRTATQWVGFGRLDWQATERQRFTLEGTGAHWNSPGGGLTRVEENYGTNSFGSSKASEEWLLGRWEAYITPNLLSVTQGSAGREILTAKPDAPSVFEQTLLSGNAWGQLPQIVVDNRWGFTIGNPSRFGQGSYPDEHLYQAQESVDWVHGKLLVRSGFELNHNTDATSLLRNQTGTYTYSKVENFISDALTFAKFGLNDALDPDNQHNCDETGRVWRDPLGGLHGLGNLPCYSYYSQTMGPTNWWLSTNDWAGYSTVQWQPAKFMVLSAGLRWEREQMPPPIASIWPPPVAPNAPAGTLPPQGLPSLGNNWGPRLSLAIGSADTHWPVLRLGYGMYYGRTENATIETALTQTGSTALTQTGSLKSDLNFFMRPTDDLPNYGGGAPPFPYVLRGPPGSMVKPGAVEFAPNFRNPEVHQAVAAVEEMLPGHVEVTASALVSLGRRLPVFIDTNFDPAVNPGSITYAVVHGTGKAAGPITATQITVPFYASWPFTACPSNSQLNLGGQCGWHNQDYQQIDQITSKANSTYEAAMLKVVRYGRRGLSLYAHYTYSHTMDWNPNESPLDPAADFRQEYGTSSLDARHSAAVSMIYEAPWKLHKQTGKLLANGWMVSSIGQFRSGLPYTMRTSGSLAEEFTTTGAAIVGLRPGMNGSGGDNRVYGQGSDNRPYNIGRNTYRYPATWKADLRLGKSFDLGHTRQLELLAESFNLFNHQNVTELESTGYYIESGTPPATPDGTPGPPTLNFLTGLKANTTAFGQPLNVNGSNFYRERQIQFGLRMRF
jgi:hypothetical protein